MKHVVPLVCLALLVCAGSVRAQSVTLTPTGDTYITEHADLGGPTSTHALDQTLYAIGSSSFESYPLVLFDLSGYAGQTVSGDGTFSAYLSSVHPGTPATQPRTIDAYQVLVGWDPATATYANFGAVSGLQIGSDVAASPFAALLGITATDVGTYLNFTVPQALLQSWIDDPSSNFGILLRNEALADQFDATFASSEGSNSPRLAFEVAGGPVTTTPEPISVLLLGTGLAGVLGARRRRARRTESE